MIIKPCNADGKPAPAKITQEQLEHFLWNGISFKDSETITKLLNASGWFQEGRPKYYDNFIEPTPVAPVYDKVNRAVRIKDLEVGGVIRFVNTGPEWDYFVNEGLLTAGKEYTITEANSQGFRIPYDKVSSVGVASGFWTGGCGTVPFDFVSNPNYVHGFRIGETVYVSRGAGSIFKGPLTVTRSNDFGNYKILCAKTACGQEGGFDPGEITRDETKAEGYVPPAPKPEPKFKVGDVVYSTNPTEGWQGPLVIYEVNAYGRATNYLCRHQGKPTEYQGLLYEKELFYAPEPEDWEPGDVIRRNQTRLGARFGEVGKEYTVISHKSKGSTSSFASIEVIPGVYSSREYFEFVRRPKG